MALQSLLAAAQKRIDVLCREAHELMLKQTMDDVAASRAQTRRSELNGASDWDSIPG